MPRLTRNVAYIRPGTKTAPRATALPALRGKLPSHRFQDFCRRFLVHVKGPQTGQPVMLARWQVTQIVRPLFDTRGADGRRQYRVCYLSCPRKSGKSTLGAAIALYLTYADAEGGADIISAAGSADQAAIIFDTAAAMVARSPALRDMTMAYRRELRVPSLGASYRVISAEAGTAHGLNLHGAIIDELHVWPDRNLYDALVTATGARAQPLVFIATTAGDGEHSICAEVHRHAEQVRDGLVTDPQLLPVIYAAPADAAWQDEAVWRACNPALGTFRSLEEMRSAARQALDVPGREASFRRFYLNQWGVNQAPRWLNVAAWDACGPLGAIGVGGAAIPRAPHPDGLAPRGTRAFLGLDLSTTSDLTALACLVPDGEGAYDVTVDFWCPGDSITQRSQQDRVPYAQWADEGWLTATPGNVVDYTYIEARLHALMARYQVEAIAVDPWNARGMIAKWFQDGMPIIEMGQTMAHLSSASKALERLVLSRQLRHDGNPLLRWCVGNAVADLDGNSNIKPSKRKSTERIDGVSAIVTGLARAIVGPVGSVYDTRGLRIV
jgi:phage terminase large subunit-like protein